MSDRNIKVSRLLKLHENVTGISDVYRFNVNIIAR